jgi:asparagine synthase (glutamine-hydrolysing)
MCGFCGELNFNGSASAPALAAMSRSMVSRGPDASGLMVQDTIGFGHRRLSVIDPSPAAQQPMADPELGLAIVFNGCIYNFRELRRELAAEGYRFFSEGDTEVILKAYAAWGPRCVERFYGMFAFALWERDSGRVVLARDRLGIKPLYLAETGGRLRFASTLPALLAAGGIDTSIDPVALHHYMSFHAAVPAPMTILKGVRKLPAATLLIVEPDGSRREEVYWTLSVGPRAGDRDISVAEWRVAVAGTLRAAVERHRAASVPVGVLLSGGLDSSLITALLAQTASPMPQTFSIGFDTVGDQPGDEFHYSDLIARHYGTEHHRIRIDASRALDVLPGVIGAMSEPMMSHDAIGFYLLAEEVSRHVKAVQSGQGADEIFGGYHWYPALMQSNDVTADYAKIYFDRDHAEMAQALTPAYLSRDYSREFINDFFAKSPAAAPIGKVLQLDAQVMMVEDPVKRLDNMTMAWGLETRVPFLDHEAVELAARIPADLKVRGGGKYILKEAARGIVPDAVIDRPKGYFPVPALKYLRGPVLAFVRDVLNSTAALRRGLFNRSYIQRLLENPEGELTPKGNSKLWQVAVLEHWMQTHGL